MRRKTTEEFKQEVLTLGEGNYEFLSEYVNNKTKGKFIHKECKKEFDMTPDRFKAGNRCPECANKKKGSHSRSTIKQFKQEVFDLVGDEYTVISDKYINNRTNINMRHNKCNHVYTVSPSNFKSGKRCPKCFGKISKTLEQFKQEVFDLVGDEYTVISDKYINTKTKITMKHNLCGKIYNVTPSHFLHSNSRCPECINLLNSFKERMLKTYLEENDIEFTYQFKTDEIKNSNNRKLSFDFLLHKEKILIEIDGEQHFHPCFKEELDSISYINRKENDKIRNEKIKNTDYTLLRIPYRLINKDYFNLLQFMNNILENLDTIKEYDICLINKHLEINKQNYYKELM